MGATMRRSTRQNAHFAHLFLAPPILVEPIQVANAFATCPRANRIMT
jgi:hypothetical protein